MGARVLACAVAFGALTSGLASAQEPRAPEDGAGGFPFREGDVVTLDQIESLRKYLPPEFWANRDFFFLRGDEARDRPLFADYSPSQAYQDATARFAGRSKLGPENSLENHTAGQPFPMDQLDCKGDPQAGVKIVWNFDHRWTGDGAAASYYYSYWDRSEELPLYFEGTSKTIQLAHRVEPEYLATDGDIFRGEKRKSAFGVEVNAPFDVRGTVLLTYRYKDSEKPRARSGNDDTWVYVPTLRRVRRISAAQSTDAVSGTDFTFDDLLSFSGVVPQYEWTCLGDMELLAPMNSKVKAYPYARDHNFGPYGLSYADDRWELRKAVKIRFVPRNPDHPYHHKDLYLDRQTLEPMYSFAYDRKEELWKISNHRWSAGFEEYEPWGVSEPRDLRVVSDTIVNVQTGTGNRIEFWDNHGTRPSPARARSAATSTWAG